MPETHFLRIVQVFCEGSVPEWLNGIALKAIRRDERLGGSNPSASARNIKYRMTHMPQNQNVIFDLDGVLIDSELINIKAGQIAFDDFGYELSENDLKLIPGRHSSDYVPIIIQNNSLAFIPTEVAALCHEKFHTLWEDMVTLMPQAKETLLFLREEGVRLALVTSSGQSTVLKFLSKFALENFFTAIVSADDVQLRKPNPEPYLKAIQKLNRDPVTMMVVEDTEIGVTAAKEAGLKCIAVPNRYTQHQNFSKADHVVASLEAIKEIV